MLRYHMVVVTKESGLKRAIKRITTATGSTADFFATTGDMNIAKPVQLAIYDAREEIPDKNFYLKLPASAKLLLIIGSDQLVQKLSLFEEKRVTSLFCHDDRFDDNEFIASATKALRGDVFGLHKYFPWGVTTFTMVVKSYEEKGKAIDIMMRYATLAGVRGPVRDRIQLVADELMMNALYHAPVDKNGAELYAGRSRKDLAQLSAVQPIQVQYGCSGQYFGIAVRDGGGSLTRKKALNYLLRAKTGATIEQKATGAGLGLVTVVNSVSKLVFNLSPGYSTEGIGMFDMELFAKGKIGARSIHIFEAAERSEGDEAAAPEVKSPPRAAGWIAAALLGAAAAALGTAVVMRDRSAQASPRRNEDLTLTVVPSPPEAEITINGEAVDSGVPFALPDGENPIEVTARLAGYETWTKSLSRQEISQPMLLHVALLKTQ